MNSRLGYYTPSFELFTITIYTDSDEYKNFESTTCIFEVLSLLFEVAMMHFCKYADRCIDHRKRSSHTIRALRFLIPIKRSVFEYIEGT